MACGAGDFLLHAARRWPSALCDRVEIDALACAVAGVPLRLAGVEAELRHDNAQGGAWAADFDLVVGSPPWGLPGTARGVPVHCLFQPLPVLLCTFLGWRPACLRPGRQMVSILPEALCEVWAYRLVWQ